MLQLLLSLLFVSMTTQHVIYHVTNDNAVLARGGNAPVVAYVEFNDTINTTGWSFLTVRTNATFSDQEQARAAGIGEGYVTAHRIRDTWVNTLSGYCKEESEYCTRLKKYIDSNRAWMRAMVMFYSNTYVYWHHIDLIQQQIEGLFVGFNMVHPGYLTEEDFYLMNFSGDLEDLEQALGAGLSEKRARKRPVFKTGPNEHVLGTGSCSAFIKWLPDDLLASQITWNSYQSMVRVIKHYNFAFRNGPGEEGIMSGRRQVFTSYPGYISSGDDYTLIGSGLVTMETTIGNNNASLWQYISPYQSVPEFMRGILANRLAYDAGGWCEVFEVCNSGTYNNQWMIVDYKQYTPGSATLQNGTLYVLEQIPGHIVYDDQTSVLRAQKYWPSYNTAFYPEIFNKSGNQVNVEKYGPMFAYDTTPRALIFRRDQHKVTDMKTLYNLMRYNDYKHDPLSTCQCNPPYSAENAIAARSDLNPADGTYLLPFLGHRLHGATDYKGTNSKLMWKLGMNVEAGPTSVQQPPFRWSTSDWSNVSHQGMVDLQQFQAMTVVF